MTGQIEEKAIHFKSAKSWTPYKLGSVEPQTEEAYKALQLKEEGLMLRAMQHGRQVLRLED